MTQVRFWQVSDLPYLLEMAAVTAWEITPPDDRPFTSFETVAGNAQQNVLTILGSPGGTAIVAVDNGTPVGFLLIGTQAHDKTGEPRGYLADIYVAPAYRRAGVSKDLHRVGEEFMRSCGLTCATTWTHAHNQLGQRTAAHHGYNLWGMMMVKRLRQPFSADAGM